MAFDVDGDGKMDIISSSQRDDSVRFHRNPGDNFIRSNDDASVLVFNDAKGVRSVHTGGSLDSDNVAEIFSASQFDNTVNYYRELRGACSNGSTLAVRRGNISNLCERCPPGHYTPTDSIRECFFQRCPPGTVDHDNDPSTRCRACGVGHSLARHALVGPCSTYSCPMNEIDHDSHSKICFVQV